MFTSNFEGNQIIDRIAALVRTLEATNYEVYDGDKEETLDELITAFDSMLAYANHVIQQQYAMPIMSARLEGQEFRDYVSASDTRRRHLHLGACARINMVNRICRMCGAEEIFPGVNATEDREGRRQAAMCIGSFINAMYNCGIGNENADRAFDAATFNRSGEQYDSKRIADTIEALAD